MAARVCGFPREGGPISSTHIDQLQRRIDDRSAVVTVVGLGYVGLPLVGTFLSAGFEVVGFDTDEEKIQTLARGETYLDHLGTELPARLATSDRFIGTSDPACFGKSDSVHLCVPTPLDEQGNPDLGYVESSTRALAEQIRPGTLVVLESTSYPGTTREVVLPILKERGFRLGEDLFVAFSPERVNPGATELEMAEIPKLVGGLEKVSASLAESLYQAAFETIHPVESAEIAEAAKILENIYRSVNIALVNEMKVILQRMGIDIWTVIEAASSKPFGYQPFYPGPGLGGHCVPIDPFYLSWKARQEGIPTRFIELAGEINTNMPAYLLSRIEEALKGRGKDLDGARVLLLGIAYKPDVDDSRETPAAEIIKQLKEAGSRVVYHDPHIPRFPRKRHYRFDLSSIDLTAGSLADADCVVIVTDHAAIDWRMVADHAPLIVDTRNVIEKYGPRGELFKA